MQTKIYITVLSAIIDGTALWLRWHERPPEPALDPPSESNLPD
ncbi:MAG TPA: hypothetical protein PLX92_07425 [Anaerolineaceae bacterium]|nr:hypothetical protein [Anaerolineaceae bacterium]HUM50020.1 hypothetical protein [Anaerolineaceae bacterium]